MVISGYSIGHCSKPELATGVTVLLFEQTVIATCLICGSAPATREVALLAPDAMVPSIDALVFAGGSAFGLGAADGVMQWLRERQRGFATAGGRVPIVPTACIYDLNVTRPGFPTATDA